MPDTHSLPAADATAEVRRFNRFYTRQLGLLNEKLLNSAFTLTEARILYELAHQNQPQSPTDLSQSLVLDPGYLSRILKAFETRGLIARAAAPTDGRRSLIALTPAGRSAFEPLDRASQTEVKASLGRLAPEAARHLIHAMRTIECLMGECLMGECLMGDCLMGDCLMGDCLMGETATAPVPVILRPHQIGDLGWITHRQGILYAQEYGWDQTFEALVAEILAAFAKNFEPARERSWIAVRDNQVIGSVFLTRGPETVAKLRLLYVEPSARGLGIGRRLVDECIGFAREAGYQTLTLWTNDVLLPARRIYQAAGFTCVAAEPYHSFGKDLVGETWELALRPPH